MGCVVNIKCLSCNHEFEANQGGGFYFHLLRCNKCGKSKNLGFDEIYETHCRHLKGIGIPFSMATAEHDRRIIDDPDIKPISNAEYKKEVERIAGSCECGGHFILHAPIRCPKCGSTELEELEATLHYD